MRILLFHTFLPVLSAFASAPKGPWDNFNIAPLSRTVYPAGIYSINGSVVDANLLVGNKGPMTLSGSGSWAALDFGLEVAGLISMNIDSVTTSSSFAFSFTESPNFIRPYASDDSSNCADSTTFDGILSIGAPLKTGQWTQPANTLRGGFRYLTIVSKSNDPITISNVSCALNFMPHVANLRDYGGYFYAQDPSVADHDLLTKIWYSGAYTIQTNIIPVNTGRHVPLHGPGAWENDAVSGVGSPIMVDGAKRDRAVWPGDMGIAVPAAFVALGESVSTKNSLATLFQQQNPTTGSLPFSGPPLNAMNSDTYHGWTLIGTHTYYTYSGDIDFLKNFWPNYTKAVEFLDAKVDSSAGLLSATGAEDWGRLNSGGINAPANAIYYRVLTTGSSLATSLGLPSLASNWDTKAASIKANFNKALWDESAGMYRDSPSSSLYPQDGNSLAVLFNLTSSLEQAKRISDGLIKNWNAIGPVSPELPDIIIPFISGFEVQAHFEAGSDARALELTRRMWGWMLTTETSVKSTFLEGLTANGSLAYRYYNGYNNDPAYTSHSHGWSTGPTPALTTYIVGLRILSPQGKTFDIAPHVDGGLPRAEGGLSTPLGWFGVKWELEEGSDGTEKLVVEIESPPGTQGTLVVPPRFQNSNTRSSVSVSVGAQQAKSYATSESHRINISEGGKRKIVIEKQS